MTMTNASANEAERAEDHAMNEAQVQRALDHASRALELHDQLIAFLDSFDTVNNTDEPIPREHLDRVEGVIEAMRERIHFHRGRNAGTPISVLQLQLLREDANRPASNQVDRGSGAAGDVREAALPLLEAIGLIRMAGTRFLELHAAADLWSDVEPTGGPRWDQAAKDETLYGFDAFRHLLLEVSHLASGLVEDDDDEMPPESQGLADLRAWVVGA